MKTLQTLISRSIFILKMICILSVTFFINSCDKDNIEELDCEFQIIESFYYPDKNVRVEFNILPKGGNEPYSIKWFNPENTTSENPYAIFTDSTQIIDFEITDAGQRTKRFNFNLSVDSIRAISRDYRYQFIGTYECLINSTFEGSTKIISDTLKVTITNDPFYHINIHTRSTGGKWYFWGMRYNYGNSFYGYHAGVSFKADSIFYTRSGPMGAYYTNVYKGRKISETVIF